MPTAYVALEDDLLVVREALDDPAGTRVLADHDPECVLVHPAASDRVLVGTFDAGLFRSTDGGDSWQAVGASIDEQAVTSLAAHPDDPATLYAGTEPSAVYHSTDGGDSWTRLDGLRDLPSEPQWSFPPRPHTDHVRWIEVDPQDPVHLYVGIEAGALVQTRDGGETWDDRIPDSPRDTHTIVTDPDAPGRAWVAAGDGFAVTEDGVPASGVNGGSSDEQRESDGGETWTWPQEGLDHRYCWSVAVDPGDSGTVLVSAASGAGSAHRTPGESYVYRRSGDSPWERLADHGIPTGEGVLRAVFATRDEPGEVWAANDHGLFRTTDAGDSWERVAVDWPDAYRGQTVRGLAVVD